MGLKSKDSLIKGISLAIVLFELPLQFIYINAENRSTIGKFFNKVMPEGFLVAYFFLPMLNELALVTYLIFLFVNKRSKETKLEFLLYVLLYIIFLSASYTYLMNELNRR